MYTELTFRLVLSDASTLSSLATAKVTLFRSFLLQVDTQAATPRVSR